MAVNYSHLGLTESGYRRLTRGMDRKEKAVFQARRIAKIERDRVYYTRAAERAKTSRGARRYAVDRLVKRLVPLAEDRQRGRHDPHIRPHIVRPNVVRESIDNPDMYQNRDPVPTDDIHSMLDMDDDALWEAAYFHGDLNAGNDIPEVNPNDVVLWY